MGGRRVRNAQMGVRFPSSPIGKKHNLSRDFGIRFANFPAAEKAQLVMRTQWMIPHRTFARKAHFPFFLAWCRSLLQVPLAFKHPFYRLGPGHYVAFRETDLRYTLQVGKLLAALFEQHDSPFPPIAVLK